MPPQSQPQPGQLDPTIVNLAKAIRDHETGGNFNASRGKDGEMGAYQIMPKTWKAWAGEHLGDPNAEMTPLNQNQVAYKQIEKWKNQGMNVGQIASMWNSGSYDPNSKADITRSPKGMPVDVGAYVNDVADRYQKYQREQNQQQSPPPPLLGESDPNSNFLTKIGKFFGMQPLGEAIGRGLFRMTPESGELNRMQQQGQIPSRESVIGQAPSTEQVAGSALQTGALGTPFGEAGTVLSKIPIAGKFLASTAGKLGLLGALTGGGKAMENQASTGEVAQQAGIGTGIGLATAGLGAAAQGVGRFILGTGEKGGLPARLLGNIFKTSTDEQLAQAYAIVNGETPPATLRGVALREHMMGSDPEMLVHSLTTLKSLEGELQNAVGDQSVKIINRKGYVEALKTINDHIGRVAFGTETETQQEANRLLSVLNDPFIKRGGKMPASDALALKRFLDDQRSRSSFYLDQQLAPKQEYLKSLANDIRTMIKSQVPDSARLLGRQKDFIRMRDAIVEDAVRRDNKQVMGLADAFLVGGGAMMPHGLGAALTGETMLRGFQEPSLITRAAQALSRTGELTQKAPNIGAGRMLQKFMTAGVNR